MSRKGTFAAAALGFFVVFCLITLLISTRVYIPTGDEPHYLIITHSLALDGDISLQNNYAEQDYFAFYPGLLGKRTTRSPDNSLELPTFGLGMPLFLAPFYRVAFILFPSALILFLRLIICAVASFGLYQLMLLFHDFSNGKVAGTNEHASDFSRAVLILTAGAAFASPLITYSSLFYPEIFAFVLVVISLRMLYALPQHPLRSVVWLSLLPGIFMWVHPKYITLAAVLTLLTSHALYQIRGRLSRAQIVHAMVTLAGIATFFLFLHFVYGSWSPNRIYGGVQREASLLELLQKEGLKRFWVMGRMLVGFWIDERFGILVFAPMYAVFFAALIWGLQNERSKLAPAILLFIFHFLTLCWGAPLGGHAPPARHFVVVIPMLLLPVLLLYQKWSALQKKTFAVLQCSGIVIAVVMFSNYRKIFSNITWRNPDGISEFWQLLHIDRWIPNLTATRLEPGLIAVWIFAIVVLSRLFYPYGHGLTINQRRLDH